MMCGMPSDQPRYRVLAAQIVAQIKAGTYPPGTLLPSLREMGGRGVAQGASRWLQSAGWVVADSTRGLRVADPLPDGRTLEERVADLEAWRATVEAGE
jgi:DNA-binding transcriptional regulator YhcF (GntR family)